MAIKNYIESCFKLVPCGVEVIEKCNIVSHFVPAKPSVVLLEGTLRNPLLVYFVDCISAHMHVQQTPIRSSSLTDDSSMTMWDIIFVLLEQKMLLSLLMVDLQ